MTKRSLKIIIILLILFVATFLRLYGLADADTISDEANYGYRSLGLLDYDDEPLHTTPIEWFDPQPPSWLKLSFNDAPPLFFYIQHVSFLTFGDNRFALRFPSAILGIASVLLTIVIATQLYNSKVGILVGILSSVSVSSVFISRVGLIESSVIFLILTACVFLLQARKNTFYFIPMGVIFGFALLTKYTAIVFAPLSFLYILFFQKHLLTSKKLWLGYSLAILLQTPVLIYNYQLYNHFGHFDFALINLFNQHPEVWKVNPGGNTGTFIEKIQRFIPKLFYTQFWGSVILFFTSLFTIVLWTLKNRRDGLLRNGFLLLSLVLFFLLLTVIGPSSRFITMAGPFMRITIALVFIKLWTQSNTIVKQLLTLSLAIFISMSFLYTVNTLLLPRPIGPVTLAYAQVGYNSYKWGYSELGDYLSQKLKDRVPAFTPLPSYKFLESIRVKSIQDSVLDGDRPYPVFIIYDQNIAQSPAHWIFERKETYYGWPVYTTEEFMAFVNSKGKDYFNNLEATYYFITPFPNILLRPAEQRTDTGELFEANLINDFQQPTIITTKDNLASFKIYKWKNRLVL